MNRRQQGFTLIELMVVVVIIGIMATAVTITAFPSSAGLSTDAQRLAQLFAVAQSEVHIDGRPIIWRADSHGYRFERRQRRFEPGNPLPTAAIDAPPDIFAQDEVLRPRAWSSPPLSVRVDPPPPVMFTAEWIAPPLRVVLSGDQGRAVIFRDASGNYVVE